MKCYPNSFRVIPANRIPLIIFGFDGYGWELYQKYGNKAPSTVTALPLQSVFPSLTFPNFYTIATVCDMTMRNAHTLALGIYLAQY